MYSGIHFVDFLSPDTIKKKKTIEPGIFLCAAMLTYEAPFFHQQPLQTTSYWFYFMSKSDLTELRAILAHQAQKVPLIFLPLLRNICIFVKTWWEEPEV